MQHDSAPGLPVDTRQWPRFLSRYRNPSRTRSIAEIALTVLPLIALWVAMWASLSVGVWLCLLLAIPTAGFLVRLFIIQHDCSHEALFQSRRANAWVGRVIGVVTLTPHGFWKRTHAVHHAAVGNLALRGLGDVPTITVREYLGRSDRRRVAYRLMRHPVVLFGVGPAFTFFIRNRLPFGLMNSGWQPWASTMATNLALAVVFGGSIWILGVVPFLLVYLPTTMLAATAGVWLFYVQHQFEDTHWAPGDEWSHAVAALQGSSHYHLPGVLRWFTGNIGVHHVHHLNSRIPFYRLPEVLRNHGELAAASRLTVAESIGCVRLALWDEQRQRLVSFREMWRNVKADASGEKTKTGARASSSQITKIRLTRENKEVFGANRDQNAGPANVL